MSKTTLWKFDKLEVIRRKEVFNMNKNRIAKIVTVIEFIEKHLTEKIDLDSIANAVHYSKYHLHRVFTNL